MKALVKKKNVQGLWLEDVPEPKIGINDVLIKMVKTSICGTDVHIYNWDDWAAETIPVPMVVGHEFSGEIAALGHAVSTYRVGQRVSGEGHIVCGTCRNCRAGRGHLCRNTLGVGVHRAMSAAAVLAEEGIAGAVIDLRSVWPLDRDLICSEASRSGRLLVVDEDYARFGLSGELAAIVLEQGLSVRFARVCVEETIPFARHLEYEALPNVDRIVTAARALLRD